MREEGNPVECVLDCLNDLELSDCKCGWFDALDKAMPTTDAEGTPSTLLLDPESCAYLFRTSLLLSVKPQYSSCTSHNLGRPFPWRRASIEIRTVRN